MAGWAPGVSKENGGVMADDSIHYRRNSAHIQFTEIQNARILVVDDKRPNRLLLQALLERGGFTHIQLAESGIEALAIIEQFKPDLILLELLMPYLDGYDVCRRLRAVPIWSDLPIVVQSSLNRAEDRVRALAAGATDYVSKPIHAAELLLRVNIHLQNRMLLNRLHLYHERTAAELALAVTMQERLMPQCPYVRAIHDQLGISLAAHFSPSSELGGDFWGMRCDDQDRLVLWLVDFSGHGIGAALNTFRLHAIINEVTFSGFDPAAFLAKMNRRLYPLLPTGQFATMLVGVIDQRQNHFLYASAGATRPMAWQPDDSRPTLGDNVGLPLGVIDNAEYENKRLDLNLNGRLFLYSDALIELPIGHGFLDESGLEEMIIQHKNKLDAPSFLQALLASLAATGDYEDDATALIITRER